MLGERCKSSGKGDYHVTAMTSKLANTPALVGGRVLQATFRVAAHLRSSKPLHPNGVLLRGWLDCPGTDQPTGVPWVDGTAQSPYVARISRAVGTAAPLPDIPGLALRWQYGGRQCDLLFAGTGLGRANRFVLVPRRSILGGAMTTLFPLSSPRGPLLFAVTPGPGAPQCSSTAELVGVVATRPLTLTLSYAGLGGPWTRFATLVLDGTVDDSNTDPVLRFHPVSATPVGLHQYEVLERLRRGAYVGARAGYPTSD